MPEGVSRRALARLLGVSETAVRKAIKAGHIHPLADGSLDADAARAAWSRNTDPARTRVRTGANPVGEVRTLDDARAAVALIARVLREEGAPELRSLDFDAARTAETILKARERDLRMQVTSGKLVDAERAHSSVFAMARQDRDALMNWPARIAPILAAELGCDQVVLAVALEKHVRQHLAERADPDLRLTS